VQQKLPSESGQFAAGCGTQTSQRGAPEQVADAARRPSAAALPASCSLQVKAGARGCAHTAVRPGVTTAVRGEVTWVLDKLRQPQCKTRDSAPPYGWKYCKGRCAPRPSAGSARMVLQRAPPQTSSALSWAAAPPSRQACSGSLPFGCGMSTASLPGRPPRRWTLLKPREGGAWLACGLIEPCDLLQTSFCTQRSSHLGVLRPSCCTLSTDVAPANSGKNERNQERAALHTEPKPWTKADPRNTALPQQPGHSEHLAPNRPRRRGLSNAVLQQCVRPPS